LAVCQIGNHRVLGAEFQQPLDHRHDRFTALPVALIKDSAEIGVIPNPNEADSLWVFPKG
jgi:hypothetical protein